MIKFFAWVMLCAFFAVLCFGLINIALKLAPTERRIDCAIVEFHPDYTADMKEQCREQRRIKA